MGETVDAILNHSIKGLDPLGEFRAVAVDLYGRVLAVPVVPYPTFRAEIGVVGPLGFAAELIPATNRVLIIHKVYFSKPTVTVTMKLKKNSSASTGGTSSNSDIIPMDSAYSSQGTTLKLFTVAPTAGVLVGDLWEGSVTTVDWIEEEFGGPYKQPLKIRPGETLAVDLSVAATIVGHIEWSEAPL